MKENTLPAPGVLQDLQAAVDYAARAGKVGIVGYCWGGLLTWRAACTLHGRGLICLALPGQRAPVWETASPEPRGALGCP